MFERITKMVSVIFLLFPKHIQHKIPPVTPIHENKYYGYRGVHLGHSI